MNDRVPWGGMALALAGSVTLFLSTFEFWLSLAVLVVWIGSLWLSRPAPDRMRPRDEGSTITQDSMRDLIEPLNLPYLVMEHGRITLANKAARDVLGGHVIGQDARVALRHPEAVRLLDKNVAGEATIRGLTGPKSVWQFSLRPVDTRRAMIELVNRTAEADISRAHTDFVANASHELRTPLASIIGYVETLIDGENPDNARPIKPETRARFLETIAREAKRLQALVEDLMSLSRIEAEKHELPPTVFDFGPSIDTLIAGMQTLHGKDRIEFKRAHLPMPIRGDEQQVHQLVRNLIENALKYGADDQPARVSLQLQGDLLELTIRDTGEGIAPEHIPHLTRRFYRTDPGRSRAVGGTGLGLAIVKHIVERHRGRLAIESTLGVGTTVIVRLPRWQDDSAAVSA
ncbi:sensor histidine kinase [Croceicoccus naphthovorans]|uniref:sensor histidine kinase n=1 Tax=Croceicoccus naphthovorans TaxID=1348774 RepID=UPI0017BD40FB|nr:ATP-binding protein [Croceicoccus naphthovorans]MBB3990704.1 two-component system phosphate regulon sensor histidine kinase PhoR [Croceicoccus naphthovorans]